MRRTYTFYIGLDWILRERNSKKSTALLADVSCVENKSHLNKIYYRSKQMGYFFLLLFLLAKLQRVEHSSFEVNTYTYV